MSSSPRTFDDWLEAERFCDGWAGDSQQHIVIVEDFGLGKLLVMPGSDAAAYIEAHDAEIQYEADGTPSAKPWED